MAQVASPPLGVQGQARAIVFIGFMGAGKSTAARILAGELGWQAVDSDEQLRERFGHSVAEEFEVAGEESFRAAEREVVCALLENAGREEAPTVLALGGGSILSEPIRRALEPHLTVLLDIDAQTAWERVTRGSEDEQERPLARERESFYALHSERRRLYEGLADAVLPASPRESLSQAIPALLKLAEQPAGTKLLWASASSGSYPVFLGRGIFRSGLWPTAASRRFVVSDETVADLYLGDLAEVSASIRIVPGERHKTLASAQRIWQELAQSGMTRADQLVALGGGVVGDLAGFCAATYQRGVPIVHVPSTLVAQVDSAYGGKTGVDLPEAKNYVGAYHQPAGVLVDPSLLETLPAAEFAAGWVEVLKTALIAGGELWHQVADDERLSEHTILACARTKLAVVAQDERDGGARQALNLGHTVGHAIEVVTRYERFRHGEAVGLGLLVALRLSGQSELRERVAGLLATHGLPVSLEGVDVGEIVAATARDKKRTGAHVPFVLLDRPGDVRIGCEVAESELRAAVSELVRG